MKYVLVFCLLAHAAACPYEEERRLDTPPRPLLQRPTPMRHPHGPDGRSAGAWSDPPPATQGSIVQPLSHFNPAVNITFNQLYWTIDAYSKTMETSPVFLYIGGPGALSEYEMTTGHQIVMAKAHGALVLGLEQRFFGSSIPDDGLEMSKLQYMSTQEGLADLAAFCMYAEKKYNIPANSTWIVMGCGYGGSLAAWFRTQFPHLVYASVASSASVREIVNFEAYNEAIASDYGNPLVYGWKECRDNISEAFGTLGKMLRTGQQAQVQKDFNTCQDLTNIKDAQQLVFNIQNYFMSDAQNNVMHALGTLIWFKCVETMGPNGPYQALVDKYKQPGACADVSYEGWLASLRDLDSAEYRQWFYQTCTQLGYFKTCDKNTSCIFGNVVDLDYYYGWCSDVYNIPAAQVQKNIDSTNTYYGDYPRGTRILFVNGFIDPFHNLSVLKDIPEQDIQTIYMNSTSFCQDIVGESEYDNPELIQGRLAIENVVSKWLKMAELEKRQQ